jgi:hypothetical protein
MEKKQIENNIFYAGRSCSNFSDNRWRWSDVKKELDKKNIVLEDTDILEIGFVEGYDEGDSARDAYYDITVTRVREETDDEFENRKQRTIDMKERSAKLRYKKYLELKKEFDEE